MITRRIARQSMLCHFLLFGILIQALHGEIISKECNSVTEFRCKNNNRVTCIPLSKLNDGQIDCVDGSDEACQPDEFHCGTMLHPMCINSSLVYDDRIDCANGRDEGCPEEAFICKDNSSCISAIHVKDGVRHCADGSDEECSADEFQCADDGKCIAKKMFQDGISDCKDGSDEACLSTQHECLCGIPRCLDKKFVNDGIKDCVEGSDEESMDTSNVVCPDADLQELMAVERKRRMTDQVRPSFPAQYKPSPNQEMDNVLTNNGTPPTFNPMETVNLADVLSPTFTTDITQLILITTNTESFHSISSGNIYQTAVPIYNLASNVDVFRDAARLNKDIRPCTDCMQNFILDLPNKVVSWNPSVSNSQPAPNFYTDHPLDDQEQSDFQEHGSLTLPERETSSIRDRRQVPRFRMGQPTFPKASARSVPLHDTDLTTEQQLHDTRTTDRVDTLSADETDVHTPTEHAPSDSFDDINEDGETTTSNSASKRKTLTLIGFVHFTTTVSDTEIVFMPRTMMESGPSRTKSQQVEATKTSVATDSLNEVPVNGYTSSIDIKSSAIYNDVSKDETITSSDDDRAIPTDFFQPTTSSSMAVQHSTSTEPLEEPFASTPSTEDSFVSTTSTEDSTITNSMLDHVSFKTEIFATDAVTEISENESELLPDSSQTPPSISSVTSKGDDFDVIEDPQEKAPEGVTEALQPIPPNSTDIIFNRKGVDKDGGFAGQAVHDGIDEVTTHAENDDKETIADISVPNEEISPSMTDDYDDYPTGLVTSTQGFVVNEGTTTHYTTMIYGTFIHDNYAQIVQSTSRLVFEVSSTGDYNPTTETVDNASSLATHGGETINSGNDNHTNLSDEMPSVKPKHIDEEDENDNNATVTNSDSGMSSSSAFTASSALVAEQLASTDLLTERSSNQSLHGEEEEEEEIASSNEGIKPTPAIIFNSSIGSENFTTVFATHTYFTTYFLNGSTSVESRQETISSAMPKGHSLNVSDTHQTHTASNYSDYDKEDRDEIINEKPFEFHNETSSSTKDGISQTIYSTVTYFTTFFLGGSTSTSSRTEVITNIMPYAVSATNPENRNESITLLDDAEEMANVSQNHTAVPDATADTATKQLTSPTITRELMTFYTTYTFFTTFSSDGDTFVESREVVSTNIGPPESLVSVAFTTAAHNRSEDASTVLVTHSEEMLSEFVSSSPIHDVSSMQIHFSELESSRGFEESELLTSLYVDSSLVDYSPTALLESVSATFLSQDLYENGSPIQSPDMNDMRSSSVAMNEIDESQLSSSVLGQKEVEHENSIPVVKIYGIVNAFGEEEAEHLSPTPSSVTETDSITEDDALPAEDEDAIVSLASAVEAEEVDSPALESPILASSFPTERSARLAEPKSSMIDDHGGDSSRHELSSDFGEPSLNARAKPSAALKTFYTTYTYYTTYFSNGQKAVSTNKETVSNVVTEPIQETETKDIEILPTNVAAVISATDTDSEKMTTSASEKTTDVVQPVAPKTFYTTYTYYTTTVLDGTPTVLTSRSTASNAIDGPGAQTTEPAPKTSPAAIKSTSKKAALQIAATKPVTYYTTYTYYTTFFSNGSPVISTTMETVSNVVNDGILPSIHDEIGAANRPIKATPTPDVEFVTRTVTYYTTYTYFTTSYDGDETHITSNLETVSNVETKTSTAMASSNTRTSRVTTRAKSTSTSSAGKIRPTSSSSYPTGLISTTVDEIINDGTTTIYSTEVFGTYINGVYAHVVQSTSKTITDETVPESSTATDEYPVGLVSSDTSSVVSNDMTTIYTTKVLGTYIDGTYAQIVESTSQILNDKNAPDDDVGAPSAVTDYKTGLISTQTSSLVRDDTTTIFHSDIIGTYVDGIYAQIIQSTSTILSGSTIVSQPSSQNKTTDDVTEGTTLEDSSIQSSSNEATATTDEAESTAAVDENTEMSSQETTTAETTTTTTTEKPTSESSGNKRRPLISPGPRPNIRPFRPRRPNNRHNKRPNGEDDTVLSPTPTLQNQTRTRSFGKSKSGSSSPGATRLISSSPGHAGSRGSGGAGSTARFRGSTRGSSAGVRSPSRSGFSSIAPSAASDMSAFASKSRLAPARGVFETHTRRQPSPVSSSELALKPSLSPNEEGEGVLPPTTPKSEEMEADLQELEDASARETTDGSSTPGTTAALSELKETINPTPVMFTTKNGSANGGTEATTPQDTSAAADLNTEATKKTVSRFRVPLRSNRPTFKFRGRRPGGNADGTTKDSLVPSDTEEEFEESVQSQGQKRIPPSHHRFSTPSVSKTQSGTEKSAAKDDPTAATPDQSDSETTTAKPSASTLLLKLRGNRRNRLLSSRRKNEGDEGIDGSDQQETTTEEKEPNKRRKRSTAVNAETFNEQSEAAYGSREYDYSRPSQDAGNLGGKDSTQPRSTPPRLRNRGRSNTQPNSEEKSVIKVDAKISELKTLSKAETTQRQGRNRNPSSASAGKTQPISPTKTNAVRGRQTQSTARGRQRAAATRSIGTRQDSTTTPPAATNTRGRGRTVTAPRRAQERVRTTIRPTQTETTAPRIRPTKALPRRGRPTRIANKQRTQQAALRATRTTTAEAETKTEKPVRAKPTVEQPTLVYTPVTVTHILNTTKILPIYRGLRTEIRTISTTFPSEEVIQPSQYTVTTDGGTEKTILHSFVTIDQETPALTNIEEVVITSRVEQYSTTTRGRVESSSRTINFLSTIRRSISQAQDATLHPSMPFGSYILSQLLFNQFFPNQQHQVTYSTSTYSYVTTVTVESITVFPIKFRDKTKLTTLTESSLSASTITSVTSVPVTVAPSLNLNLLPALLNPMQYPQGNGQQQNTQLPSILDDNTALSNDALPTPPPPPPPPPLPPSMDEPTPNLTLPPPGPVTSVITIYLSGVKPGQYNTFLTTVTLDSTDATDTVDLKISRETRDAEDDDQSLNDRRKRQAIKKSRIFEPTGTEVVTYTLSSTVLLDGSLSTISSEATVTQVATNNHWYDELTKTNAHGSQSTAILYAGGVPVDVLVTPENMDGRPQDFPLVMGNFEGDFPPFAPDARNSTIVNEFRQRNIGFKMPTMTKAASGGRNIFVAPTRVSTLSRTNDDGLTAQYDVDDIANLEGEESELSETSQVFFQRIPDEVTTSVPSSPPNVARLKLKRRRRPLVNNTTVLETMASDIITEESIWTPTTTGGRRKMAKRRRKLKTTPLPPSEQLNGDYSLLSRHPDIVPPSIATPLIEAAQTVPLTYYTTFTYFTTVYDGSSTSFKTQEALASRITTEPLDYDTVQALQEQYNQQGNSFVNLGTRTKGYKTTVVILGSSVRVDASDDGPVARRAQTSSSQSIQPEETIPVTTISPADPLPETTPEADSSEVEATHTIHTIFTYLYTFNNDGNTRYSNREITTTSLVTGTEIPSLVEASGLQEHEGKYVLGDNAKTVNIGSRVFEGTTTQVNMAMKTLLELQSKPTVSQSPILPTATFIPVEHTRATFIPLEDTSAIPQRKRIRMRQRTKPTSQEPNLAPETSPSSLFQNSQPDQMPALTEETPSQPVTVRDTASSKTFGMRTSQKQMIPIDVDSSLVTPEYYKDSTDSLDSTSDNDEIFLLANGGLSREETPTLETATFTEQMVSPVIHRETTSLQQRRRRPTTTPASTNSNSEQQPSKLRVKLGNRLNGRTRGAIGHNNYASRFNGQNGRREKHRSSPVPTPSNVIMVTYTTTTLVPFLGDTSFRTLHIRTSSLRTLEESEMYLLTAPHLLAVTPSSPTMPMSSDIVVTSADLFDSTAANDTTDSDSSSQVADSTESLDGDIDPSHTTPTDDEDIELETVYTTSTYYITRVTDDSTEVETKFETVSEVVTKSNTDSLQSTATVQSQLSTLETDAIEDNDVETPAEPSTTEPTGDEVSLDEPEVHIKDVFSEDDETYEHDTTVDEEDEASPDEPSESSFTDFDSDSEDDPSVTTEMANENLNTNNAVQSLDSKAAKQLSLFDEDVQQNDSLSASILNSSKTSSLTPTIELPKSNDDDDDEASVESDAVTRTYFTTFSYFNTYPAGSTSVVVNSTSTTSNVVVEKTSDGLTGELSTKFDTSTVYTTNTYFSTEYEDDTEHVLSTEEVIKQVIITEAPVLQGDTIMPTSVIDGATTEATDHDDSAVDTVKEQAESSDIVSTESLENTNLFDYVVKTYYTTFTYFTTYLVDDRTSVASTTEVSSNVATERERQKMSKTKIQQVHSSKSSNLVTRTYYTTFTYFTTYLQGSETTITSSLDVVSNVVIETAAAKETSQSSLRIKATETTSSGITSTSDPSTSSSKSTDKTDGVRKSTITPSRSLSRPAAQTSQPNANVKTYYTTYTYFTTYFEGSETVISSSEETVTNAVTLTDTSNVMSATSLKMNHMTSEESTSEPTIEASVTPSPLASELSSPELISSSFEMSNTEQVDLKTIFFTASSSNSMPDSTIIFFPDKMTTDNSTNSTEISNNGTIVAEESVHDNTLTVISSNTTSESDDLKTKKPNNGTMFNIGPMLSGLAGLLLNGGLALGAGAGSGGASNNAFVPPILPLISNRNDTDSNKQVIKEPVIAARPPVAATMSGLQEPNFIPVGGLGASMNRASPVPVLQTKTRHSDGGFTRINGPLLDMPHPGIVIDVEQEAPPEHNQDAVVVLRPSMEPMFNNGFRPGTTEKGFTPITSKQDASTQSKLGTSAEKETLQSSGEVTTSSSSSIAKGVTTITSVLQGQSTIFFNRRRPQHNSATIPTIALLGSDTDEIGFTRIPSVSTVIEGASTTLSTFWIQQANTVVDTVEGEGSDSDPIAIHRLENIPLDETSTLIRPSTTTYYTTHTFYTTTFIDGNPIVSSREETSSEVVILRPLPIAATNAQGDGTRQTLTILTETRSGTHTYDAGEKQVTGEDVDALRRGDGTTTGLRHKFITGETTDVSAASNVELKSTAATTFPSDMSVIQSTFSSADAAGDRDATAAVKQIVQRDEQTHFTVAHYYTEMSDQATPVLFDRKETSSEIVTLSATTFTQFLPRPVTRTYFTTYYYYTTSFVGGSSVINSRAETSSQVVTLGPFSDEALVATNMHNTITYTTAIEETTATREADSASPIATNPEPRPGYATYYTRFTYFTTFLRDGISAVTSNIVTYTQVVPQITRTILLNGEDGVRGGGYGHYGGGINVRPTVIRDNQLGLITRLPEGQVTAYRVVDGRTVLYIDSGATRTLLSTRIVGAKTTAIFGGEAGQENVRYTHVIDSAPTESLPAIQTITITETINGGTKTLVRYITPTVTTIATVTTTIQGSGGHTDIVGGIDSGRGTTTTVLDTSLAATEGGDSGHGATIIGALDKDDDSKLTRVTGGGTRETVYIGGGTTDLGGETPPLKTEYFTRIEKTGRTVIGTRTTVRFSDGIPETKMFPFTTTIGPRTMLITVIGGRRTLTRLVGPTIAATDVFQPTTVTSFTTSTFVSEGGNHQGSGTTGEQSGRTVKPPFGVVTVDTSDITEQTSTKKEMSSTTPQSGEAGGLHLGQLEILSECKLNCDVNKKEACRFLQGRWQCGCRRGQGRVDNTRTCEPVLTYELMLNLIRMGNKDLIYTDKYRNVLSTEYQDLANKCKLGLQRAYAGTRISQAYRGSEVIGFSDARLVNPEWRGVVARVAVSVRESEFVDGQTIKEELNTSVKKTNYSLGRTDLVVNPLSSALQLKDLDECSNSDLNDCHSNATCVNTHGSFTCKCSDGMHDLDAEFPGRVCGESSAMCDLCNYQGDCIKDEHGNSVCHCYPWHLGDQCQINALPLAIILPIILGLLLLALLLWCCCCRKGGCCGMGPCCRDAACCGPGGCCSCCGRSFGQRSTNVIAATNGSGGVFPRIGGSIDEGAGTLDKKAMITEDSASDSSGEQSRFAHIADAFGARATDTQKSKKSGKMNGHSYEDRTLSGFADVPPVVIPRAKHQHQKQYVSSSTENILQRGGESGMTSAENKLINILEGESHDRSMNINKESSSFATMPHSRSKSQTSHSGASRSATMERSDRQHQHKRSANVTSGTSSSAAAAVKSSSRHGRSESADKRLHDSSTSIHRSSSAIAGQSSKANERKHRESHRHLSYSSGYGSSGGRGAGAVQSSGGKYSKGKQMESHSSTLHDESRVTESHSYNTSGALQAQGRAGGGSGGGTRVAIGGREGGATSEAYRREYNSRHATEESEEGEFAERETTTRYRGGGGGERYHSNVLESESYSKQIGSSEARGMMRDYDADSSRYGSTGYDQFGTRTVSEVRSCDETTIHPATRTLGTESNYSSSKGRSSRYTRTGDETDPTDPEENITDVSVSTMMVPSARIYYKEDSCDYSESSDQSTRAPVRHEHSLSKDFYESGPSARRYERQSYYNYERNEMSTKHDNYRS